MTIIQKIRARLVICQVAHRQGISTAQCRAEMVAAISEAWVNADPRAKQRQIQLVGEGRVPTPEELIIILAGEVI